MNREKAMREIIDKFGDWNLGWVLDRILAAFKDKNAIPHEVAREVASLFSSALFKMTPLALEATQKLFDSFETEATATPHSCSGLSKKASTLT
jgi:hypothetical protein